MNKNPSKPKIESKSGHRRIATEANDFNQQQQNYESYMEMNSKIKSNQNMSGILEGFMNEPIH